MKKFVGKPSTQLEAKMGLPNERLPDGQGGEIWNYVEQRRWTTPEQESHVITGAYNTTDKSATWMLSRPHVDTVVRSFYVNTAGFVYNYKSRED